VSVQWRVLSDTSSTRLPQCLDCITSLYCQAVRIIVVRRWLNCYNFSNPSLSTGSLFTTCHTVSKIPSRLQFFLSPRVVGSGGELAISASSCTELSSRQQTQQQHSDLRAERKAASVSSLPTLAGGNAVLMTLRLGGEEVYRAKPGTWPGHLEHILGDRYQRFAVFLKYRSIPVFDNDKV
jgi:hypothetical protein